MGLCDSTAYNGAWLHAISLSVAATSHRAMLTCIPVDAFLRRLTLDPYIRRFVSLILDILTLGIFWTSGIWGTSVPPWTFVPIVRLTVPLCRLQRASYIRALHCRSACRSINGSLSGRYSVIRLLGISVLLQPLSCNASAFHARTGRNAYQLWPTLQSL
jgi:hypothetical protein